MTNSGGGGGDDVILIVDDDPGVRDLLTIALRRAGYQTIEAATGEEALATLARHRISLALVDLTLPTMSGTELVREIRNQAAPSTLPVIVVSAAGRASQRVAALDAGADDFLAKPVRVGELVARVNAHLRRGAAWAAAAAAVQTRRAAMIHALCAIVADDGRDAAGEICRILSDEHGGAAVLAFPDGETVVCLAERGLTSTPLGAAELSPSLAAALRERAANGPWVQTQDSGGLPGFDVVFAPCHRGRDVVGLLVLAAPSAEVAGAAAMLAAAIDYVAVVVHLLGPGLVELGRQAERRRASHAIVADRRFDIVFQPIIDLEAGTPVGFEALTRFHDGSRPDLMFAEAHDLGHGVQMELAVIAEVLRHAERLPDGAWLAINVSPTTLCDLGLYECLSAVTRPLVLEITEHDRVHDYGAVRDAMRRLPGSVRLSVDDAGAGFASLDHILQLEPEYIKLDRSWVRGIDHDVARQALVGSLGYFSDRFGCTLIAEGIETDSELAMLRTLHTQLGQGYLLGRPSGI